jgi:hypothetical protein
MGRYARTIIDVAQCPARSLALSIMALFGTACLAQQAPVRGHIKGQEQYLSAPGESLAADLGHGQSSAASIDLRLSVGLTGGHFGFEADYLLQAITGSAVELQNDLEALDPELFIDRAKTQWLPLDDTLADSKTRRAVQSLDRLSISYTTERWVFKLGRQAYSWGNGIVFRPFDIFDPFAPDVLDDSYKPGIDTAYVQRLLANGSDIVALLVPRRDPATGEIERSASSAAVKWHQFGGNLQTDWLIARDYLDTVAGLGLSGSLGQAVWRLSLVPVWLEDGGTRTSLVANIEHAWQWRSRSVSGFIEFFRNGFGRADSGYALDALDALEPELVERLARGQVFNTGRDYVAGGLRIELSPLFEIDPILLLNLHDRSALAVIRGSYSIAQNLALDFGLRRGIGSSGTEFGGLPVSTGSTVLNAPPTRLYARIAYYF